MGQNFFENLRNVLLLFLFLVGLSGCIFSQVFKQDVPKQESDEPSPGASSPSGSGGASTTQLTYNGDLKASLWEFSANPAPAFQRSLMSNLLSVRSPLVILPQDETVGNLQALHFGELEVIAYSYRPGQSTQAHANGVGFTGSDWSYWPAFVGGVRFYAR